MAAADTDSMKPILLLLTVALLASCAIKDAFPAPQPCKICDASAAPRHDAPVRLFNDDIPTPCGRPHPGWSTALRQRMARERLWASNPTLTPMDYEGTRFNAAFRVPTGIERDVLLWRPKTP